MHPLLYNVGLFRVTEQQGRIFVMRAVVFQCLAGIVAIAVFAAVGAGVVSADVPAFDAVTAQPGAFVCFVFEYFFVGICEHVKRHTALGINSQMRKITVSFTGLNPEWISCGVSGTREGIRDFMRLSFSAKPKIQRST